MAILCCVAQKAASAAQELYIAENYQMLLQEKTFLNITVK
jgi:hypothetical protein